MSGEHALIRDPARVFARALDVLSRLSDRLPEWTLIGGLAVIARLSDQHRATGDLDMLSDDSEVAIATVRETVPGAKPSRAGVVLPDGTVLDIIDASPAARHPDDELDLTLRMAVEDQLAYAYAHLSATGLTITARHAEGDVTDARLRVATPAGLVALKLHSASGPKRNDDKRGTDVYDIARLTATHGPAMIADQLAVFPPLAVSCKAHANAVFGSEWPQTRRWMARTSRLAVGREEIFQIERVGQTLVAALDTSRADLSGAIRCGREGCALPLLRGRCIIHGGP